MVEADPRLTLSSLQLKSKSVAELQSPEKRSLKAASPGEAKAPGAPGDRTQIRPEPEVPADEDACGGRSPKPPSSLHPDPGAKERPIPKGGGL